MKATHRLILIFLYFSTCQVVYPQDPQVMLKMNDQDIDTTVWDNLKDVLFSSRSTQDIDELPVSIYVITREEILENGYITLVDVLKSVPGIKVSQPGSAVDGETFLMRGLYGNYYTKILIDDIPVQPSVTGGMPIGGQLPVRQAKRIEIILGPISSLYGADAMAGIINIVTNTSDRPIYAQADISVGSEGYEYLNVMIGGKIGKRKNVLEYSFFGNFSNLQDSRIKYDIQGNYNPALYDSSMNYLSAPYYQGDTFSPVMNELPERGSLMGMKLRYRGFTLTYLNMKRRIHSSIGQNTAYYSYAYPMNFWAESIDRFSLAHEKNWDLARNKATISYLYYRLDRNSSLGLIYDLGVGGKAYKYAASDDIFIEDLFTIIPRNILEINVGASFQYSGNLPKTNDLGEPFDESRYSPFSTSIVEDDSLFFNFGINPVTFWNLGGFAQLYLDIGRFDLVLSGRIDYHSIFGSTFNPRLAVMYNNSENFNVWASIGSGFLGPSTYFSYSSQAHPVDNGIFYTIVPNPDLKPEIIRNAELGMRWTINDVIKTDAQIFYHILDNQISRSVTILDEEKYPDAINPYFAETYVNDEVSEARLFGIQINAMADDIVESIKLDLDLYLSFNSGTEKLPNELGELEAYRMVPPFMGQFNIAMNPVKGFYLFIRNIYSASTYKRYMPLKIEELEKRGYTTKVPEYYTLDFILRYTFYKNLQAFFQMNNVFNKYYGGIDAYGNRSDLLYNPQHARSFKVGLSFSIE